MPRRKRNETENQFEGLIGQGQDFDNEKMMADLLNDMQSSKTRHHGSLIRMFTKQDSKEYQDVEKTLGNVVFDVSTKFTNDVAANEKLMTKAMGDYYKLLAACEKYINKKGGTSDKGATRRDKVKQIQQYAQRDLMGIEQAFHAMKSMNAQQQSTLTWDEILHSARMEMIEVEDYSKLTTLGAGVKQGDTAGKLMKEGVFAPQTTRTFAGIQSEGDGADIIGNTFRATDEFNKEHLYNKKITTKLANRNVATSRVANLIGLGGIVEQSQLVQVKDKSTNEVRSGSLMTPARGTEMHGDVEKNLQDKMEREKNLQERERMAKETIAPSMQKELSSLQVLDYICGQGDRHRGNYFVEKENGKYTHLHGIDNDTAFSTGVDADTYLKKLGFYGSEQHWRVTVDSKDNLVIPHMDKQLAKNIVDLKPDELRFVLKDLLEPVFVETAVQRLQKLQRGIIKEMSKTNSEANVFLEEGDWDATTLEDFLAAGTRRKMEGNIADKFKKKMFYMDNKNLDESYGLSKGDNYISALIDFMVGFNARTGHYDSK